MTRNSEESLRYRQGFHDGVESMLIDAMARGLAGDELTGVVAEAISVAASSMVQTLAADRPRMLAEHVELWVDVERIVAETWGEALDQFYAVIVCAEELGRIWNYANLRDADADDDRMFLVMSGLLVRAIRTSLEVYHLLRRGFPAGATARARSLYELAVVSRVMVEHGSDYNLPMRYLRHQDIDRFLWMQEHQRQAEVGEVTPLGADEVEPLEDARDELAKEFGEAFCHFYGWAAPLFDRGRISPVRLASKVDMSWGRPDYVAESHDVHATALGAELNMELDGMVGSWRLTGLADPANATMVRLVQVLGDTLVHGRTDVVNQYDMLGLGAVFRLVEEAEVAFLEAEAAAADRLQRERVHPEPPPMQSSEAWGDHDP